MLKIFKRLNERSVLYLLISVTFASLMISAYAHWQNGEIAWWSWIDGAFQNFSTEMMGAIITFGLFELVIGKRNELDKLLLQLRSKDPAIVENALDTLKTKHWLYDGTLRNTNLTGVNLGGLDLTGADLQNSVMKKVSLKGCNLTGVNLTKSVLRVVYFDEKTVLPDGNMWIIGTDYNRFTNPNHPEFWQPK